MTNPFNSLSDLIEQIKQKKSNENLELPTKVLYSIYLNYLIDIQEKIEANSITNEDLATITQNLGIISREIYGINKINDPSLGLELFKTYRSMIEHEDNLLNQRLTWFLVAQGFLFAAFGTVIASSLALTLKTPVLFSIAFVGSVNSLLIFSPILVAMEAVGKFTKEWRKRKDSSADNQGNEYFTKQVKDQLPSRINYAYPLSSENRSWPAQCFEFSVWGIPGITLIVWLFLFGLVSCNNGLINKNQQTQAQKSQVKSGQTYLIIKQDSNKALTLKAVKEKINSANSAFQAKICQKKPKPNSNESKESVLIVAPKGYPSFHLPTDIADSTEAQIKQSSDINFLRLTDDIDKLYDCQ